MYAPAARRVDDELAALVRAVRRNGDVGELAGSVRNLVEGGVLARRRRP